VVPAWVGPLLAVLVFVVLGFLIPAMFTGSQKPDAGTLVIAPVAKVAAPCVAVVVLVGWVVAEIQKWKRKRLLDGQSGLRSIRDLSWREFEHLVGEAYRRQGYLVEETGSAGGDGGIDLKLTRLGELVVVQCKRWRTWNVGVKPVRELFGVMHSESATRGILVTCGFFSSEAKYFAEGKPLELVEGLTLWELVRSVKTPSAAAKSDPVAITAVPQSSEPTATLAGQVASPPKCPQCGEPMILREARKGPNPGSMFWGCCRFPQCRGTRKQA